MDYSFIKDYKDKQQTGFSIEEKRAYESVIQILFRMKLYGKEKARQIDEYDGESLFSNTTLYPGHIYAFIYKAKNPSIYDDGQIKFTYSDTLPIVLVTHAEPTYIRGINLNLCSYPMRAYVLNTLHNLDLQFYRRGNLDIATKNKAPISENVMKTFMTLEKEKAFFDFIKDNCKL